MIRRTIWLHETDLFREWLKGKGYIWPERLIDQENIMAEFFREGLEMKKGGVIQLIAWRTTGKNPCDDPPVNITIAPVEKMTFVFPWIIPLERAVEMFGQSVIDNINDNPVPIKLSMEVE